VQAIREKLPALNEKFSVHLIGRLQSNKVKYIIKDVCLIHSLDRMSLAQEIDRQYDKNAEDQENEKILAAYIERRQHNVKQQKDCRHREDQFSQNSRKPFFLHKSKYSFR